jgi:hypothetical protein
VTTADEGTATAKAMVGMNRMSMTVVVIDAVFVEVASMFYVVTASVHGGCVLVGGPHHFHCLTPFYSAGMFAVFLSSSNRHFIALVFF